MITPPVTDGQRQGGPAGSSEFTSFLKRALSIFLSKNIVPAGGRQRAAGTIRKLNPRSTSRPEKRNAHSMRLLLRVGVTVRAACT